MKKIPKAFFALCLLGLLAGFLNGLLGSGGGILIVGGLSLLYGKKITDNRVFYPTALSVMLPLSALSAFQYGKAGILPEGKLLLLLLPALLGGLTGGLLLSHLPTRFLSRLFAGIVLISGVVLVL